MNELAATVLEEDYYVDDPFAAPVWSRSDDKLFEEALAATSTPPSSEYHRWRAIASRVPGKSLEEVLRHYQKLLLDVAAIESGSIQLPDYNDEDDDDDEDYQRRQMMVVRKRGVAWTEEEHKMFLKGLKEYGRGDWRNISRMAVKTKTPTQVASHAQKFFLRQQSRRNDAAGVAKRRSIHDITLP